MTPDRQWYIVGRWQEFEGEGRANWLRLGAILAFYVVQLANYYGPKFGFLEMQADTSRTFHLAVTGFVLAWGIVCLSVYLCRTQGIFPSGLKYYSTGCDLVLLTSLLLWADGPRSPLAIGYFLIVVLSGLRFSLGLVRFATVGAVVGYGILLAYARWFSDRDVTAPRYQQALFALGLVVTGLMVGQMVRRVRNIAEDYARRMQARTGGQP